MEAALGLTLQSQSIELEPDIWTFYVNLQCPDPILHRLTGACHDCENRLFELEDKDVPTLASFMRLAMSCKALYQFVR
jgi:hypothetical protein